MPNADVVSKSVGSRSPSFGDQDDAGDDVQAEKRDERNEKGLGDDLGGDAAGRTASRSLSPRTVAHNAATVMLKVVVLTPPPVLPGDAPMNISAMVTKSPACGHRADVHRVEAGGARGDRLKPGRQHLFVERPAAAERPRVRPLEREKRHRAVPTSNSAELETSTTFVCSDSASVAHADARELAQDEEAQSAADDEAP